MNPEFDADLQAALAPLRERIDAIDARLVELVNERARVAVEIGARKRQAGGLSAPVYVPGRERAVIDKVKSLSTGPLPDRTLEAIWREIMSGSVRLQTPLRVAYLGPPGSFSHAAATGKFGASVEYVTAADIPGVFDAVSRGHADHGLVPVENSTHGGVIDTLDAFLDTRCRIAAEVLLGVHHQCLSRSPWEQVQIVASKPEVFAQCRQFLANVARGREVRPVASTSAAAELAASDPAVAAIASRLAGEIYDVPAVFENIEDVPENVTRFFVIARDGELSQKPTGDDKTGVLFTTANRPGALAGVLDAFRRHGVNLTDIEKRPSGRMNWEYVFFVDAQGHAADPAVSAAVDEARGHCLQLTVLGSYPRAGEVL